MTSISAPVQTPFMPRSQIPRAFTSVAVPPKRTTWACSRQTRPTTGAISSINAGIQYYCTWSYSNGYPTTTLSASVAASGASITPVSVTGIYPGTTLTLYDMPYDEQVQVASTYVPGGAVLPLTTGVQYDHASGVMVTNLPPAIKQAAILATTAFIKQRGSGAMVVADLGAAIKQSSGFSQDSGSDWAEAKCLLNPFRQMFVGT